MTETKHETPPRRRGKSITIERVYAHPVSRVWHALTDRAALAEWLMENDFEPRVGHEFTFRTDPGPGFDGIVRCEVLELDPEHRLVYSWKGGPLDTVITYTVESVEGGTRLRIVHEGFEGLRARLVRMLLRAGLRSMLRKKLPALLDRLGGGGSESPSTEVDCPKRWRWFAAVLQPFVGRQGRSPE